jgi:glycosyltransferase involved in cell wall biosynthesis
MRLLIVLHQFFPEFSAGTEHVALNLARMAQRAGHHVEVLTCAVHASRTGEPVDQLPQATQTVYNGVPVITLPRALLPASADHSFEVHSTLSGQLAQWIKARRFDIAHVLHPMRMATAIKAIQQAGLPYVLTLTDFFLPCVRINLVNVSQQPCQGPDEGKRCAQDCRVPPWDADTYAARYQQAQAILLGASACVAPSEYVARRYRSMFSAVHVRVIPHGIDLLRLIQQAPPAPGSHQRTSGPTLALAYVGSIVPQKGLQMVLRALAQLPQLNLTLKVAGALHGDPVFQKEITQLAAADTRVTLLGQCDSAAVAGLLSSVDLLCIPSIVPESYSLVLREAAALGVPALVSDQGAPADLVRQTGAGAAVPIGDVQAWAQAITHIYSQPAQIAQWRSRLPLPARVEEEAFLYESLYRQFLPSA